MEMMGMLRAQAAAAVAAAAVAAHMALLVRATEGESPKEAPRLGGAEAELRFAGRKLLQSTFAV